MGTKIEVVFLGTKFEVVFLGTKFEVDNTVRTYSCIGYENQRSPYGTIVGTKIKAVHIVSLARFLRQQVDRNFDCKISEFSQFAKHCG